MNNIYGLDVDYFSKELFRLRKSLPNRPPNEVYNYLMALAKIVQPPTIAQQPQGSKPEA